jgi:biopolymer transport protein ExbD
VSVHLPRSNGKLLSTTNALDIRVTDRQVFVAGVPAVALPPLEEMKTQGLGRDVKQEPNRLYVLPLAEAIQRSLSGQSSAVLYVDVTIPYRALIEILFTLSSVGVSRYLLATDSNATESNASGSAPGTTRGWTTYEPRGQPLGVVTVLMVNLGFALRLLDQVVDPGCSGVGGGVPGEVAVRKLEGGCDYGGLTRCLESLRPAIANAASTSGGEASLAQITANFATPYFEIIGAVDALSQAGITEFQFKVAK